MATTLDEEFQKTLQEFAHADGANARYSLATVRLVAESIDGDADIWSMSADEADRLARRYRLMAAYSARGAAICDDRVAEARADQEQART
jgi:hypothetical protein